MPTVLTGMRLSCAMLSVAALAISTSYSFEPIFDVPDGRIRFCVQVHLYLTLLSPVRIGDSCTLHSDETGANEIEPIIVELLLRNALAGEPQLEDGDRRGAVGNDQGRCGSNR